MKGVGLLAFVSFSEAPNLNDNGLAGFASSLFTPKDTNLLEITGFGVATTGAGTCWPNENTGVLGEGIEGIAPKPPVDLLGSNVGLITVSGSETADLATSVIDEAPSNNPLPGTVKPVPPCIEVPEAGWVPDNEAVVPAGLKKDGVEEDPPVVNAVG